MDPNNSNLARFAHAIKPFHTVAYVMKIEEGKSQYLLLRRCGKYLYGNWQMVSGGIEEGETAWKAALREIQEETNLIPEQFYSADAVESFYEVLRDAIVVAPVFVAIIESQQEIKLSAHEHDAFKWMDYDETLSFLEFDNQKRIIKHIEENFATKLPNERLRIIF
ncbi:MAG: NUDIX domain-containing protein [Parachlamydiaceae bacterium]